MIIKRKFILGTGFEKEWANLKLKDDDLRRLQRDLLSNPKTGPVMRGVIP